MIIRLHTGSWRDETEQNIGYYEVTEAQENEIVEAIKIYNEAIIVWQNRKSGTVENCPLFSKYYDLNKLKEITVNDYWIRGA